MFMLSHPPFTADEQTAGRGRRERVWHSSPGDGLYLSVLLRPELVANRIPLLSLMAAIVVAEAVKGMTNEGGRTSLEVDIKWPNDVLVNGRKLSGVLIESISAGGGALRVIVGIGVNLNHQTFPPELQETATSLALECGWLFPVTSFRDALLDGFAVRYEELRGGDWRGILRRWQELSSYAAGKPIVAYLDQTELRGETAGLTETGALLVRTADGQLRQIVAGEVNGLRPEGGKNQPL